MRKSRWFSSLYIWLVMAFLYAPIAVLIIFSFNDSKSRNTWTGFTLRWYEELFHDRVIMQSFLVMLVVAIVSSVIATVLGTLAAIGLDKMNKKLRSVVMTFTYLPMINPGNHHRRCADAVVHLSEEEFGMRRCCWHTSPSTSPMSS